MEPTLEWDIDGPYATVPVELLRKSLWYYDNYFIQRDLAASRGESLDICISDLDLCNRQLGRLDDLERRVTLWRSATIGLGITTVGLTALVIGIAQ